MCTSSENNCLRQGCVNKIKEERGDSFCSDLCSNMYHLSQHLKLKDQYSELSLAPSEFYNVKKKRKQRRGCEKPGCTNKISQRGTKRRFCSKECYAETRKINRFCQLPGCKNPLHTNKPWTKYCSVECRQKSERRPEAFCLNTECGKKLEKRWQKKYCSNACAGIHRFRNIEKFTNCQNVNCGKELTKKQIIGLNKFCSLECSKESKKPKVGDIRLLKKYKHWKYPRRMVRTENGFVLLAKIAWEKANNQKVPKGWTIGYKDGNTFNDEDVENLFIFEIKEKLKSYKKANPTTKEGIKDERSFTAEEYAKSF
jgi:hypothetical protein